GVSIRCWKRDTRTGYIRYKAVNNAGLQLQNSIGLLGRAKIYASPNLFGPIAGPSLASRHFAYCSCSPKNGVQKLSLLLHISGVDSFLLAPPIKTLWFCAKIQLWACKQSSQFRHRWLCDLNPACFYCAPK
ncbi:unnamed protein product, partial [Protopolystoma xenopodis]